MILTSFHGRYSFSGPATQVEPVFGQGCTSISEFIVDLGVVLVAREARYCVVLVAREARYLNDLRTDEYSKILDDSIDSTMNA